MPVTMYVHTGHVNESLQAVLDAIVTDINLLSECGLKTKLHGVPWLVGTALGYHTNEQ